MNGEFHTFGSRDADLEREVIHIICKAEAEGWTNVYYVYDDEWGGLYLGGVNPKGEWAHVFDNCPNCSNQGWYAVPDRRGEPEQVQCEWCETTENSRFNWEKRIREQNFELSYAHQQDPKGFRFRQYAKDPLPPWAVDILFDSQPSKP